MLNCPSPKHWSIATGRKGGFMVRALGVINLIVVLALGYGFYSAKGSMTERISNVEAANRQAQSDTDKKWIDLSSDVRQINNRVGVTAADLSRAREASQILKRQQDQAAKEWKTQLAAKANSTD